jgi:hypothetical protein
MTFSRVLSLVAVPAMLLTVGSIHSAQAQFGGMPGMPGSPGTGGFGAPPPPPQAGPPPACVQLMVLKEEREKSGAALSAAGKGKAKPEAAEVCKLFKVYLATESKLMQGLSDNSVTCGVPPQVIKQFQEMHGKAVQTGKQVCEAAEHPRQAGPSLSDALNSAPVIPDVENTKTGKGTYDTLQGNALAR